MGGGGPLTRGRRPTHVCTEMFVKQQASNKLRPHQQSVR